MPKTEEIYWPRPANLTLYHIRLRRYISSVTGSSASPEAVNIHRVITSVLPHRPLPPNHESVAELPKRDKNYLFASSLRSLRLRESYIACEAGVCHPHAKAQRPPSSAEKK